MNPTQEQAEKFWMWCGWRFRLSGSESGHYWQDPKGTARADLPALSLNSLFKWAVPKVRTNYDVVLETADHPKFLATVWEIGEPNLSSEIVDKDPALALFWAIYKVMEEK